MFAVLTQESLIRLLRKQATLTNVVEIGEVLSSIRLLESVKNWTGNFTIKQAKTIVLIWGKYFK